MPASVTFCRKVQGGEFSDLITKTLFYDTFKFSWDLQKSALSFLEAADKLAGTSIKKEFLDTFDEDGDGVVTYENFGEKGIWGISLHLAGDMISKMGSERFGYLKDRFNVEVTDDPARVLTASFAGGKEIWPQKRL